MDYSSSNSSLVPPDAWSYYAGPRNPIGTNVDGSTMYQSPALDLTPAAQAPREKGWLDSLGSIFSSGDAATTAGTATGNPWASLAVAAIPGIVGGITGMQGNKYNAKQQEKQQQRQFEYLRELQAQKEAEAYKQLMAQLAVQQAIAQMQAGGKAAEITQAGARASNDSANTFLRAIGR